ncbi:MFS transporter [Mesotoga sp. UBA5557]|jgi:MFS family permease|uniref:MFS transporter n=1 Tax=Mesotoga sp. UBA5557 TaxID=1946857 RepID=UPI0025EF6A76|nr:MFS transporter [Mesotoga sp. UBA5557]
MIKLLSGSASVGIIYGIFNFVLIPYLNGKFHSTALAGNLVSAGMIITIFTGMLIGYLGDRSKKYLAFIKGLFIITIISMFILSTNNEILLGIAAVVFTMSIFSLLTPYSALVSNVSKPGRKDRNYGFMMGVMNIATFLSSLFIGVTLSRSGETAFVVFSIAAAVLVVPLFFYRSESHIVDSAVGIKEEDLRFRVDRKIVFVMISQFGLWFSMGGILPYLTSFISSDIGVSLGTASSIMGVSTLVSGVTSLMTGTLSKTLGQKRLHITALSILAGVFLSVSIFYSGFLGLDPFLMLIVLILFSFALGIVLALNVTIVSDTVSLANQGKIFGLNNIVMVLSQSLALSLIGSLISLSGYNLAFVFVAAGFAVAIVFFVMSTLCCRKTVS